MPALISLVPREIKAGTLRYRLLTYSFTTRCVATKPVAALVTRTT